MCQHQGEQAGRDILIPWQCYLCPGNKRAQGDTNPKYDSTFVFVNDYSAVREQQAQYDPPEANGCEFYTCTTCQTQRIDCILTHCSARITPSSRREHDRQMLRYYVLPETQPHTGRYAASEHSPCNRDLDKDLHITPGSYVTLGPIRKTNHTSSLRA